MSQLLQEVREQSEGIAETLENLREVSASPQFKTRPPSLEDLLALSRCCGDHFSEEAEWTLFLYLGQRLIDELGGEWRVDENPRSPDCGQVYAACSATMEFERAYKRQLVLRRRHDLSRIEVLFRRARRAKDLEARFIAEFANLSGQSVPWNQIEERCIGLGLLPDPRREKMRHSVERRRIKRYCKALKIKITRG